VASCAATWSVAEVSLACPAARPFLSPDCCMIHQLSSSRTDFRPSALVTWRTISCVPDLSRSP
jgi:hypothetical protein